MSTVSTPVEIFCSYAHQDEAWLRKLETHLSLLKRQGLVSLWHDRLLVPGTDWTQTIDASLETASVILLLVSADFIASDYCYGIEMKRALTRQEAGEVQVIPILLRPVDWETAPFAHLHALPTNAKPLTTWANRDTALANVAAGIRRVLEELPLLVASAPRSALPAIWNIPYPRNPFFLGRDIELALLRFHLQAGQPTALSQPQAISGLGGIGKTQLALEYAYRFHHDYRVVLWARAESTEALISSYIVLATVLRLQEREAREQSVTVQAIKTWLQTHRGWLLILDNADELTLLPDFLPPSLGGHLLLTTRAAATGRLAHRLEIETLLPEQGALFLLRRATLLDPDATLEQASSQDRELALQISQELGGLPLALDQAGAYLEETGTDLTSYQHIYQQHWADLLQQRRGLVADHPTPVATTWLISFERVEQQSPAAADLLRLCAFLAADAIPEEMLTKGALHLGAVLGSVVADPFLFTQTVEALRAVSLLNRNPRTRMLSIHRLVQAVLRNEMGKVTTRFWEERVVKMVAAALPPIEYVHQPAWERLVAHALACAEIAWCNNLHMKEAVLLLQQTGMYLNWCSQHKEAESLLEHALVIGIKVFGADCLEIVTILNELAFIYQRQGKYKEAESLFQRALAVHKQHSGPEHPDTAESLNNLAVCYLRQDRDEETESLYLQAHAIYEQQLGPEHLYTAGILHNLASLYEEQGRDEEAEPLYQRALDILERIFGPDHPDVAYSLTRLANLYREQGEYAQAEPLYQRALLIREQQLGPEHLLTADIIHNLAVFQEAQGHQQEALSLYRRALVIREHALGQEHPKTRDTQQRFTALSQKLE